MAARSSAANVTRWALLSAAKGTDRSTRLLEVIARLRVRGLRVGGVVQEAGPEGGGGYVAREVAGSETAVVARRARASDDGDPAAQLVCSFAFDADALRRARAWVERDVGVCDVVVIDEVSKLEVSGGGHHDAIRAALAGAAVVVLCVRADQLFLVMERFGLEEPVAFVESTDARALDEFVEALVREARRSSCLLAGVADG